MSKPQVTGDVQNLPLGSQVVTALQGRSVASLTPAKGSSLVWNGSAWQPGGVLAAGTNINSVATTGTTFAGGADLLTSALSFTADGTSTYLLGVFAPDWTNATPANQNLLHLNLDGVDAGILAISAGVTQMPLAAIGVIGTPTAGVHTINARLRSPSGTTATVEAGNGGAGTRSAILVQVIRL